MTNRKQENLITSIMMLVLGIMFLILKGGVISIAMTMLGVIVIAFGIFKLLNNAITSGIIEIVIGTLIIILGWVIAAVILYVVAALLIAYGIYKLYLLFKTHTKGLKPYTTFMIYLMPIIQILIGVLLFINLGGVVDWVFIVTGIFMIVDGTIGLFSSVTN